ncbi:MAG: MFS transporter [Bryobacter sp.]|jgi:MFS family permease|nr:MFS transporter [Bryobacter sp. CoA8 C33]
MPVSIPVLLRRNHNYRLLWSGQLVSEVGDHFNNIAVFSMAIRQDHGGLLVGGVLIARALPMLIAGPMAGVVLDRMDRRRVMIASDLIRGCIALLFILSIGQSDNTLLFLLSALLMFASPFFTSGRNSILPVVAPGEQLIPANALTQITAWATTGVGAFLGGASVAVFGYEGAFVINALSFFLSAACLLGFRCRSDEFLPGQDGTKRTFHPVQEFIEGLNYLRREPLLLAIALIGVGWATGGGAAQILFSVFGETVFRRGPSGIGIIWGCAGCGLVLGGVIANQLNKRLDFQGYKQTVAIAYLLHGAFYVAFAWERNFGLALVFIALSRAAGAAASVVNYSKVLQYAEDQYRGRVFATMETMTWATMMISLAAAALATERYDPRLIAAIAGCLSASTALFWAWANASGHLSLPGRRS